MSQHELPLYNVLLMYSRFSNKWLSRNYTQLSSLITAASEKPGFLRTWKINCLLKLTPRVDASVWGKCLQAVSFCLQALQTQTQIRRSGFLERRLSGRLSKKPAGHLRPRPKSLLAICVRVRNACRQNLTACRHFTCTLAPTWVLKNSNYLLFSCIIIYLAVSVSFCCYFSLRTSKKTPGGSDKKVTEGPHWEGDKTGHVTFMSLPGVSASLRTVIGLSGKNSSLK